jgi:IS5 family transposase
MSICSSGLTAPGRAQPVTITVSPTHPLLQLAQGIPWPTLAALVLPDLKRSTAKGQGWLGRKLKLRIHLGALLLRWLYNLTDRQVEWGLKDNAAYQLFCGWGSVEQWHAPDHTKIEEFRSRLSPETQRRLATEVAPSGPPRWGLRTPPRWILIPRSKKPISPILRMPIS